MESVGGEIEGLRSLLNSPRDPEGRAFVSLADAYRRGGAFDDALQVLTEGLGRHPQFASAHVVAAWVHQDRGERGEARLSWERVLELDAENLRALRGLGSLLLESGERERARPLLQRARSLDPDDSEVRDLLKGLEAAEDRAPARGESPRDAAPTPEEAPPLQELAELQDLAEPQQELAEGQGLAEPQKEAEPQDAPRGEADTAVVEGVVELGGITAQEVFDEPPVIAAGVELLEEAALSPEDQAAAEPLERQAAETWVPDEEAVAEVPTTRTMAELFARQGLPERAAEIYERLVAEHPSDAALQERLNELRSPSAGGRPAPESSVYDDDTETLARELAAAPVGAEGWDTPFAWTSEAEGRGAEAEAGELVADYFRGLLAWEPGALEGVGTGEVPASTPASAPEPAAPPPPQPAAPASAEVAGVEPDVGVGLISVAPVVPIESLAPWPPADARSPRSTPSSRPREVRASDHPVPIESLEVAPVVPIESLAPSPLAIVPRSTPSVVEPQAVPVDSPAPGAVPVDSLAPDALPIESLAPDAVPIGSLAPDAVPIESLAPDGYWRERHPGGSLS